MPRQVPEQSAELGVLDGLMSEGEGVNYGDGESPVGPPPAARPEPVQRTKDGEEIRDGVVKRVQPPSERTALRAEFTPEERAALEASQHAPKRPDPSPEDLAEIEGLSYLTVLKDCLNGLVAKQGWEAISDDQAASLVINMPRLYRTLRFLHKRGIYGDRKDKGTLTAARLRELIG